MEQTKSLSGELRAKVNLLWPWLSEASEELLTHPDRRRMYPEYLRAMFGISRGAVPLMRAAITRVRKAHADEVSTPPLIAYYEHHIEDERDHDMWILEDLERIGIDRSWTLDSLPTESVVALVGAQFYMIEHHHPIALLGYLSVMERSQPTSAAVTSLQERTGFPEAAFRCMRHHAIADIEHIEEVYDFIDEQVTDPQHARLVVTNALQTAERLLRVLIECNTRFREGMLEDVVR